MTRLSLSLALVFLAAPGALPAESPAALRFVDVARQAGIDLPNPCEGVAIGDVNGDGQLDLLVAVYDGPAALFLNQGNLRFRRWPPADAPSPFSDHNMAAALGDIDNDGDLDAYLTRSEDNRLYENDGQGNFKDITASAGVGNPSFSRGACFADLDNDGLLDIYLVNSKNAPNALYLNRGQSRFEDVSEKSAAADRGDGYGLAVGDVDGDDDTDLFVANMPTPGHPELDDCRLYLNRGDATFVEAGQAAGISKSGPAHGACFADVDNDGDLDLFVNIIAKPNRLYINNGKGLFTECAKEAGVDDEDQDVGVAAGDLDLDGRLDFFLTAWGINRLYLNRGSLRFEEYGERARVRLESRCTGIALGDLDGDGDLDAYLANYGPDLLYENQVIPRGTSNTAQPPIEGPAAGPEQSTKESSAPKPLPDTRGIEEMKAENRAPPPALAFLKVDARGHQGCGSPFGTKLWLYLQQPDGATGLLVGYREISSGNSYNSMNAPVAHFGLREPGPFVLRIRFPATKSDIVLRDLSPGQVLYLEKAKKELHP